MILIGMNWVVVVRVVKTVHLRVAAVLARAPKMRRRAVKSRTRREPWPVGCRLIDFGLGFVCSTFNKLRWGTEAEGRRRPNVVHSGRSSLCGCTFHERS